MSEQLKNLKENTDRRFAILMTALQDFMVAFQMERNVMQPPESVNVEPQSVVEKNEKQELAEKKREMKRKVKERHQGEA